MLLDSDAAPQPGWLENLLAPFADPETMIVGGFTILAFEDLLSRTMALSWFFDLAEEREQTLKRRTIHANNCAMRTDFFRAHPFPDLPMFKKQCEYWRKDLTKAGHKLVRTADAVTIYAPHPGYGFVAWRGWSSGRDGDALAFYTGTTGRTARLGLAVRHLFEEGRPVVAEHPFQGPIGRSSPVAAARGDADRAWLLCVQFRRPGVQRAGPRFRTDAGPECPAAAQLIKGARVAGSVPDTPGPGARQNAPAPIATTGARPPARPVRTGAA